MKSLILSFAFALMVLTIFSVNAQAPANLGSLAFFTTKYTKDMVWDVQRSPMYPVAGQDWTLTGLKGALDAYGATIDWGAGRYLMFDLVPNNSNGPNSLLDDVNKKNLKYSVRLKLFERNGKLVKVVSKWGKLRGMGAKGFIYEVESTYGTFFSVNTVKPSDSISYKPVLAEVAKVSDLGKYLELPTPANLDKNNSLARHKQVSETNANLTRRTVPKKKNQSNQVIENEKNINKPYGIVKDIATNKRG
jgi:hypothetical protein